MTNISDPIKYKEAIVIIFNLLNSFSSNDLQSWIEMAFNYDEKILDFVDIVDWEKYASVSKTPKTIQNLFVFQEIVIRALIEFIDLLLYSLKWFGSDIAKNINIRLVNLKMI